MSIISDRIKEMRKKKNLTQLELANLLGTSYRGLQNYEIDARTPTCEMLVKLADYFDVSIDYLVGRTTNPKINL